MTSQSVIFNRRVNLIAPVEASQKSVFEKVEIPTPYRWNGGKCILANQKTANRKKNQFLHAVTLVGSKICSVSICFALSLTVSEIKANLRF